MSNGFSGKQKLGSISKIQLMHTKIQQNNSNNGEDKEK